MILFSTLVRFRNDIDKLYRVSSLFIDTHVHLYHKRYDSDREEMISRAFDVGVDKMLMPAIDVNSIEEAIELSLRYKGLFAMSAIHPSDTKEATLADFERVEDLCSNEMVIAVGESGLDYYWDRSFDAKQHDFLRRHIRLAIDQDLPLILHNRESTDDLIKIIEEEKSDHPNGDLLRGIFHCFSGSESDARRIIDLGFMLGIGGTVTFKNAGVAEAIENIDLGHLLLETDGPFLAPVPNRGKRNEPSYLPLIAQKIADVKQLKVEEVAAKTSANAQMLFRLGP